MIYTLTLNPALDAEYTVPALALDQVLRSTPARMDFGGKGFNVSRMLSVLGVSSTAYGFVGGSSGSQLRDGLQGLGILTDFVEVAGITRTNVSVVTETHDHYLKVNEPGPVIAPGEVARLLEKIEAAAGPGDWWVLSGSLPPGVPTGIYQEIISRVRKAGGFTFLDTSGAAFTEGLRARPDLVKPNDIELGQVTGLPVEDGTSILFAAKSILESGAGQVIVSRGRAGALLVGPEGSWEGLSPQVQEVNPIGAGDAMVAGLIFGLSTGMSAVDALRWGLACGASAASEPGTSMGTREKINSLFEKATVEGI